MTGDKETVYAAFAETCARYQEKSFLYVPTDVASTYGVAAGAISYRDADAKVRTLTAFYDDAGYRRGHRVGLMVDNRPDFFWHWLALNALGVSVVPLNAELSATEHRYLIALSEICLLVYTPDHVEQVAACTTGEVDRVACVNINALATELPPAPSVQDTSVQFADDECALLFTSGSTGQPKACMLSNAYFLEMGRWYRTLGGLCTLLPGQERLLTPLPLTHMNAMATSTMAMIMTGGCLIQLDRFHPRRWWRTVREAAPTVIHYLGVMPAILLQLEPSNDERHPAIKFGFGAGVNPAHHARFEQRFGFPLTEGWAMTETGAGGCIAANAEPRHIGEACFGRPNPQRIEFRIVDEAGQDVAQGSAGELLVRAAGNDPRKGFFSGYYRNDEATKTAWEDGWWHTGDVVRQLPDGAMCFVDRRKNIIRRSGENIAALEVEATLSQHPAVATLAVTPAPDEIRGEEVMACVVLNTGVAASAATADDIFAHCAQSLAYFKVPGYICFMDSLPLTATQKPKRSDIKSLAADIVATPASDHLVFDFRDRKRRPPA